MAYYNIAFGGDGPAGTTVPGVFMARMFPQKEPDLDADVRMDHPRHNTSYTLTRHLTWDRPTGPTRIVDPNRPLGPESVALAQFLDDNPLQAGDVLGLHILPKLSVLERVWVRVVTPLSNFQFKIKVRGQANSASPLDILPTVDGTTNTMQLVDVAPLNGGNPLWFDQNDMLEMELLSLPPEGIRGSYVVVSALVQRLEMGNN